MPIKVTSHITNLAYSLGIFRGKGRTCCDSTCRGANRVDSRGNEVTGQPRAIGSPADDDWALIKSVLEKDRKATAEFVGRYTADVYSYVRARLAPQYDHVDDLVQETFLAAWENLSQYRGSGSLGAWVMGIARHKLEDYYRVRLRAPESIDDPDQDPVVFSAFPEFPE